MAESAETVQEDRIDLVIANAEITLNVVYQIIYNLELEETWNRREHWLLDAMGL